MQKEISTSNNINKSKTRSLLPKITPPLIIFTIITLAVYFHNISQKLDANLVKIVEGEIWRITTAIFASTSIFRMFMNIIWLLLLTKLSESRKGSFPYMIDIFIKCIIVNCFSLIIYLLILSFSKRFGSIFTFICNAQEKFSYSGYGIILLIETFLLLTEPSQADNNENQKSKSYIWSLRILYISLSIIYLPYAQTLSAGITAMLVKCKFIDCCEKIQSSSINYKIEQIFKCANRFYYFSYINSNDKQYYDNNENITIVSDTTIKYETADKINNKKVNETTRDSDISDYRLDSLEKTEGDENGRAKHTGNIDKDKNELDSFEI